MAIGDNESTDDETDDSEDISMDDSDPSVISSDDETPPTTVDKYHWTRSSINTNCTFCIKT